MPGSVAQRLFRLVRQLAAPELARRHTRPLPKGPGKTFLVAKAHGQGHLLDRLVAPAQLFSGLFPGTYTLKVNPETLPDGFELETESVEVNVTQLGGSFGAALQVRPEDYDATSSKLDEIIQSSVNGLRLGLLLALASVGLSLIYGTTGLSNFAHAEQVTLGGMMGYFFVSELGLSIWVGGLCVVLFCAGTGWVQDRGMWQPLRRRGLGLTQMMIVTIGIVWFAEAATVLRLLFMAMIIVGAAGLNLTTRAG